MLTVAIDCETNKRTVPFIVTMVDQQLNTYLYKPKYNYSTIRQICESPNVRKIFHHAPFDIYALSNIGIYVKPPYHCTMIMASLVNENYSPKKLKYLAKVYLKEECKEAQALAKIKIKFGKNVGYDELPQELIEPYAVMDAIYTIKLFYLFKSKIFNSRHYGLYKMEQELIPLIVEMVRRGVKIDREFCKREKKHLEDLFCFYTPKIFSESKSIFNFMYHGDLKRVLMKQGIVIRDRTKKGNISTGKETLEKINSEFIRYVLKARSVDKQISTYYDSLLNKYTDESDNTAHFSLYSSGAKTGRFSADLIQTIPKELVVGDKVVPNNVRAAFVVREGYVNLYADYDQVEMRLFAHFLNNPSLIQAIIDGLDPHTDMATTLFGEEKVKENPKEYRRRTKIINFGIIYGMGRDALGKVLGLTPYESNNILQKYEKEYGVRKFMYKLSSELYKKGYLELEWVNRIYRVPKELAYKAVNVLCQGSCAYIIKKAMLRLNEWYQFEKTYGIKLLNQLHDELIFEVHQSLPIIEIARKIKELMEDLTTFKVPLLVSFKYSTTNWYEKKELKL